MVMVETYGHAVGVEGGEDMRWEVGTLVDNHAKCGRQEPVGYGDQGRLVAVVVVVGVEGTHQR